jgi:hypothetical protein
MRVGKRVKGSGAAEKRPSFIRELFHALFALTPSPPGNMKNVSSFGQTFEPDGLVKNNTFYTLEFSNVETNIQE